MADVFPDLPDHPDYLPLIAAVTKYLDAGDPKLVIPRPVRIMGARKSRQAWTWAWREDFEGGEVIIRRQCSIIIDVHDPWHGKPYNGYEIKISGTDGFYLTLESRDRAPITVLELRRGLELAQMLPPPRYLVEAPDDKDEFSW